MLIIKGGRLQRVDQLGNLKSIIAENVVDFDENDDYVAAVHSNGSVVLYDGDLGRLRSRVTEDARRVKLEDDEIVVLKEDGSWRRYNEIGNFLGSY